MYDLEKKYFGSIPFLEGKVVEPNLDNIYAEIINRREEIYPNCLSVSNDSDFNYVETDWATYHDYIAVEKFPKLKTIFPYIFKSLEMLEDTDKDYFFKSWINIWPQGQSLGYHTHYGEWHGYWVIHDTGTKTYYFPQESKEPTALTNFNGHYVFMDAKIPHMAQANPSSKLRVSMGFNLSSWEEILREEKTNDNGRGTKIKDVIIPLKELIA